MVFSCLALRINYEHDFGESFSWSSTPTVKIGTEEALNGTASVRRVSENELLDTTLPSAEEYWLGTHVYRIHLDQSFEDYSGKYLLVLPYNSKFRKMADAMRLCGATWCIFRRKTPTDPWEKHEAIATDAGVEAWVDGFSESVGGVSMSTSEHESSVMCSECKGAGTRIQPGCCPC